VKAFAWSDMLLCAARTLRFVREEPRGSNKGQAIRAMLALCALKEGHAWCMAYAHWCGVSAFGAAWPLRLSARCADVLADARTKGLVVPASDARPGDLVCVWFPDLARHAHVWIVASVRDAAGKHGTWEGNTTEDTGSREGWGVFSLRREIGLHDEVVRVFP
jgi:hypothetical protein